MYVISTNFNLRRFLSNEKYLRNLLHCFHTFQRDKFLNVSSLIDEKNTWYRFILKIMLT